MEVLQTIQTKLNLFYKKYYLTQFWIGLIFTSVFLSFSWYILSIGEYFIYFPKFFKTLVFVLFSISFLAILWFKVLQPLLLFFKIKKGLEHEEIAKIIGNHFKNEVDDVLLNSIQLSNLSNPSPVVLAAIQQKINKIKDYNFIQAIDKTLLKQWFKIATIPTFLFLLTFFIQPQILVEGSSRVAQFTKDFYPPNPYQFIILNNKLVVTKNQPFILQVQFKGSKIPENLSLVMNNEWYRFSRKQDFFEIQIPPITNNTAFKLKMGEYFSDDYVLKYAQKPSIQNFTINVTPPLYTGIAPFTVNNQQFIQVPKGSKIAMDIVLEESTSLKINDKRYTLTSSNFSYLFSVNNSASIKLSPFNIQSNLSDDLIINFVSTQDFPPEIGVKEFRDSIYLNQVYFSCWVKDDYGINKTELVVQSNDSAYKSVLKLPKNELYSQFNYTLDLNRFKNFGKEIKVYFITWDNDFSGSKSSVSATFIYNFPSAGEIDSIVNNDKDELKSLMNKTLSSFTKQQSDIQTLQEELLQKTNLDWNDKKRLDNLFKNQKNLENQLQQIQQLQNIQKAKEDNLKDIDPSLLDKQNQIEELFKKLLDNDTKKLFDELQKLMNELNNKNQVQDVLDKLQNDTKKIEQNVDRTLEMFKRFEVEQLLQETQNDLNNLAKEQEEFRNELDKFSKEESINKQEEINQDFRDLKDKMNNLLEKNKSLERPKPMDNLNNDLNAIENKLKESKENLQNSEKSKAKKNQKSAEDNMNSLSQKLNDLQIKQAMQENAEDAQVLRQILQNLLYLSNKQEDILLKSKSVNPLDPKFTSLAHEQKKVFIDSKIIEDSLIALSKRQIQLQDIVTKELFDLTNNLKIAQDFMYKRQPFNSVVKQQFAMTAANNLALLLDESLQKMQEDMKNAQPGSGSCSKPGGKNPKPSDSMNDLKDMLGKQIEQMKKQLEKGSIPGNVGEKGDKGSAKDFAQMAAQQAALKEKLKELERNMQKQGKGGTGDAPQLIKDLENIEKDLYNKNLSQEMINRQKKIMTKLLEAEKGLLEQELDDQRKGETAKILNNRNLVKSIEYKESVFTNKELLNKYNPNFNLYYKSKISEYFNNFDKP